MNLKPLNNVESERIILTNQEILNKEILKDDAETIRIKNMLNPSNFLHAICRSYFAPYIRGELNGVPFDKIKFVKKLRKDLSKKLETRINPTTETYTYYDLMKNGEIKKLGKKQKEYSLQNLQTVLASYEIPVPEIFYEYIADILGIGICILRENTYIQYGIKNDRDVIILLCHKLSNYDFYEVIGIKKGGKVITRFPREWLN